ncbi:MAG TPA: thymidine phosphorylase [Chloroflexota bacterium]|jgi:pyrimidine-nucleoside phosphorylase|nr:thymidine phosphorylase [Chloroflexota bacterium]
MQARDLIAAKRDGAEHSADELEFLVAGITAGSIPDYQAAAWLMAVCLRGMTHAETAALTEAMAGSGETLDLQARWPNAVDKHSTGGVGDKTSLVLMPMLAATGWRVGKMSGRGLGFSGGTIDKLESIPGLRCDLSRTEFLDQLDRVGLVIAGQSAELAPADGKLYALRDVTATVDSIPLIAASIMSKKLACRAGRLVLDVKVGRGAFMKTLGQAQDLADTMVAIGEAAGVQTSAILSDMDEPEGYAIGNALEVREALECLRGGGPPDVIALCLRLASALGVGDVSGTLRDGSALAAFRRMVGAQGGDQRVVDEPSRLPAARLVRPLPAPSSGRITGIDPALLGRLAVGLGAGRQFKMDTIDRAAGFVLRAKVGDRVEAGEPLLEVHANDEGRLEQALAGLQGAFTIDAS